MTDTFALDTTFLADISAANGGFTPDGFTNQCMIGLDDNHYLLTRDDLGVAVLCAETGNVTHRTQTQMIADMGNLGVPNPSKYITATPVWPAPGTPYFYVIQQEPAITEFYIAALLYKIVSDGTIQCVGGLNYRTHGAPGIGKGAVAGPQTFYAFNVIGGELFALGNVFNSVSSQSQPAVFKVPLNETFTQDFTIGAWDAYYQTLPLSYGFFGTTSFGFSNRAGQGYATLVDIGLGQWGILVYIGKAEYDRIAAAPGGTNAQWDDIVAYGGPSVWWCKSTDLSLTNVTSQFAFSDVYEHRDGSLSSNVYDDYVAPSSFVFNGTTYLIFARSYTLPADLEPVGTYARARVYAWDGTTATPVFDASTALFDPVANFGVAESARTGSYPEFVQGVFEPSTQKILYVWYGRAGVLDFHYVFGNWMDVARNVVTTENYFVTFAELDNPAFTDWQTADTLGAGADFQSWMETYYLMTDDTMLWMQAPYVYVYTENSERADIGLLMQPQWDWTDDASSNKFARQVEVYRDPGLRTVAVSKNRVRGKGRALRLYWLSEHSKDFNLLGWGVDVTKNARF